MFFGIMNRKKNIDRVVTAEIYDIFSQNLDSSSRIVKISDNNIFVCHHNIGALSNQPNFFIDNYNNSFCVVAGEPLICDKNIEKNYRYLHELMVNNNYSWLEKTRGAFSAVFFNQEKNIIYLCTDKLGLRPVYYSIKNDYVIFSTQLKFIEELSFFSKQLDQTALSEMVGLGYPLDNRTKYHDVKVLREAQFLKIDADRSETYSYWRWDKIKQQSISANEATAEAYRIFKDAINIRLHGDTNALAFLSGGMDSRAIIGALTEIGVKTQAFNFSPSNSQDQIFAMQFADQIGCHLNMSYRDRDYPQGFRCQLASLVKGLVSKQKMYAARPRSIWSGDGGSVSVGCVYLDEKIVAEMRSQNRLKAIHLFRSKGKRYLPLKAMKKAEAEQLSNFLDNAILSELDRIYCEDPAQSFFLFLMFNDQRRHLHDVYEEIDIHKLEYQLPFYDSSLLEYLFSLPLDYRLNHKFYTDWFKLFPSAVTEVPWQTYPGHMPCPLVFDKNLGYQWNNEKLEFKEKLKKCLYGGIQGVNICLFARNIGPLSRTKFGIASMVHLFGIKDYDYLIKAGKIYSNY